MSFTTITGRGTKKGRKSHIRFEKRSGKLEMVRHQSKKNKEESSLKKLERTKRFRGKGLERVAHDTKSVGNFGYVVE